MTTSNQFHVFILEDSTPIADTLKMYLSKRGLQVENFRVSRKELRQLLPGNLSMNKKENAKDAQIQLFDGNKYVNIPFDNILYIQADHVYIEVHLDGGKKIIQRSSLKNIFKQLPKEQFVQTHRSFVVNINYIDQWSNSEFYIQDKKVPISRSRRKTVLDLLNL